MSAIKSKAHVMCLVLLSVVGFASLMVFRSTQGQSVVTVPRILGPAIRAALFQAADLDVVSDPDSTDYGGSGLLTIGYWHVEIPSTGREWVTVEHVSDQTERE